MLDEKRGVTLRSGVRLGSILSHFEGVVEMGLYLGYNVMFLVPGLHFCIRLKSERAVDFQQVLDEKRGVTLRSGVRLGSMQYHFEGVVEMGL